MFGFNNSSTIEVSKYKKYVDNKQQCECDTMYLDRHAESGYKQCSRTALFKFKKKMICKLHLLLKIGHILEEQVKNSEGPIDIERLFEGNVKLTIK